MLRLGALRADLLLLLSMELQFVYLVFARSQSGRPVLFCQLLLGPHAPPHPAPFENGPPSHARVHTHLFTHPRPALLPCLPRSYSVGRAPYCWFGTLDASGQLVKDFPVPLPQPIMMHDFAVTEDYVIFFDCSLVFKPEVGGGWGKCSWAVGSQVLGRGVGFPTPFCFSVRHDAPTAAGWLCAPAHTKRAFLSTTSQKIGSARTAGIVLAHAATFYGCSTWSGRAF